MKAYKDFEIVLEKVGSNYHYNIEKMHIKGQYEKPFVGGAMKTQDVAYSVAEKHIDYYLIQEAMREDIKVLEEEMVEAVQLLENKLKEDSEVVFNSKKEEIEGILQDIKFL